MLLNFLLTLTLLSNPGGAGSAMDPNGNAGSNGVLLGDGILLGDIGMHIDPNG